MDKASLPESFKKNPGEHNQNPYVNKDSFMNTLLSKREVVSPEKKPATVEKKVSVKDLKKAIEKAYDPYNPAMDSAKRKEFAQELKFHGKEPKLEEIHKLERDLEAERRKPDNTKDFYHAAGKEKLWNKVWNRLNGK